SATLSARYNFTDDTTDIPVVDNGINSSLSARARTENIALALNQELGEQTATQLRFSYGRTALNFAQVAGSPLIFQSRSTGVDLTGDGQADGRTGPIGRLLLEPFSPLGVDPTSFPQGRAANTFQFADTTTFK